MRGDARRGWPRWLSVRGLGAISPIPGGPRGRVHSSSELGLARLTQPNPPSVTDNAFMFTLQSHESCDAVYAVPPFGDHSVDALARVPVPTGLHTHVFIETSPRWLREALDLLERYGATYAYTLTWFRPPSTVPRFIVYGVRGRPRIGDSRAWRPTLAGSRAQLDATLARIAPGHRINVFSIPEEPPSVAVLSDHPVPTTGNSTAPNTVPVTRGVERMANIDRSLTLLMEINGCLGASIVDHSSGMSLGSVGGGVDLELAAAGNSEVVKSKLATMKSLKIKGGIEDILITLDKQYHVIRPCTQHDNVFIYLVLDREKANLALARRKCADVETALDV